MTAKIPVRSESFVEATDEAAYWIGMLMADGTVGQRHVNGRLYPTIKLKLQADDQHHVANLAAYVGLPSERCRVSKTDAIVQFNNKQIFDYLQNLGVTHRKTYTAAISSEFEKNRFFWCGFIDGDGTIFGREENGKTYWMMGCVGGSFRLIEQFCEFVTETCGFSPRIRKRLKTNENYEVQIYGKKAVRVLQELYGRHRFSIARKRLLAEQAAEKYGSELDGDLIDWSSTSGEAYIRLDKNPRIKHSPWRVNGVGEYYVVQVASKKLAIEARDMFFELVKKGHSNKEAKKLTRKQYAITYPKMQKNEVRPSTKPTNSTTDLYGVRWVKKYGYEARMLYSGKGGKRSRVYVMTDRRYGFVAAVMEILLELREVGYVLPPKRERRKTEDGNIYIPRNDSKSLESTAQGKSHIRANKSTRSSY